jgi:hypothetical protein
LITLGLWFIDILWVADVQAIPFTSLSSVDMFLIDQYPQGSSVGGVTFGPPDQPLIDLSRSEIQTTTKTLFGVSSLIAFVNTEGGLSTQGVAQVDTLTSPVGLAPDSLVSGHANLQIEFTSGESPLALDLSGVLHRSGATWGGLESAHVGFGCTVLPSCPKNSPQNSLGLPFDGFPVGDFPFELHTILSPGVRYTFQIGAENNLFSSSRQNVTQDTTSESRIVWNLQVRAVPMPPTLLLFGLGIIGLASATRRYR